MRKKCENSNGRSGRWEADIMRRQYSDGAPSVEPAPAAAARAGFPGARRRMNTTWSYVLVFVGGGIGAAARHLVNRAALTLVGPDYPAGTLIVNVTGSIAMGMLAAWFTFRGETTTPAARLFLTTLSWRLHHVFRLRTGRHGDVQRHDLRARDDLAGSARGCSRLPVSLAYVPRQVPVILVDRINRLSS